MKKSHNPLYPSSRDFSMLDYECAYIPENKVRMNYKYIPRATTEYATAVIQRGWRRFGKYYFHPVCNGCDACKSLRIDVEAFKHSRSQKKALKRNVNTRIIVQKPSLTQMHIDLYDKYHNFKSDKDGWKQKSISQQEYHENFVDGAHEFGKEVLYIVDDKLVGVDLIDVLDDGISSIYFFYDPDYAHLSLGKFSLYKQIEMAKQRKLAWIYLGYYVKECASLNYKAEYKPNQILLNNPSLDEEACWQ